MDNDDQIVPHSDHRLNNALHEEDEQSGKRKNDNVHNPLRDESLSIKV